MKLCSCAFQSEGSDNSCPIHGTEQQFKKLSGLEDCTCKLLDFNPKNPTFKFSPDCPVHDKDLGLHPACSIIKLVTYTNGQLKELQSLVEEELKSRSVWKDTITEPGHYWVRRSDSKDNVYYFECDPSIPKALYQGPIKPQED